MRFGRVFGWVWRGRIRSPFVTGRLGLVHAACARLPPITPVPGTRKLASSCAVESIICARISRFLEHPRIVRQAVPPTVPCRSCCLRPSPSNNTCSWNEKTGQFLCCGINHLRTNKQVFGTPPYRPAGCAAHCPMSISTFPPESAPTVETTVPPPFFHFSSHSSGVFRCESHGMSAVG
jgi:hypothetical protein